MLGERVQEEWKEYIGAPVGKSPVESVSALERLCMVAYSFHSSRYRRVAFLECDLGQSEFTPGGLVALNIVENYAFGESIRPSRIDGRRW